MKRFPVHLVTTHRCYSIGEPAEVLGVATVATRRWCRAGLLCLSDAKPFLIEGGAMKTWYGTALAAKKVKLGAFEIYCLTCKTAGSRILT